MIFLKTVESGFLVLNMVIIMVGITHCKMYAKIITEATIRTNFDFLIN